MNQQAYIDSLIPARDVTVSLERLQLAGQGFDVHPQILPRTERVPMLPWPSQLYEDVVTQ